MRSALWTALSIGLLALLANAQTETVVNAAGLTVVEVITVDAAGIVETEILSTVLSSSSSSSSSTSPLTPSTPSTTSSTPSTTSSTPTTTLPQGPVGQPAPTSLDATEIEYTYTTTDAEGDTTAIVDVFTPSFAPTTTPPPLTSGTILGLGQYLSQVGTHTVAANSASMRRALDGGWYGAAFGALTGIVGGVYLVLA